MLISINWVRDFVDLDGINIDELIHKFSLSTAEVENEIFYKGSDLSGVVVAEIKSVEEQSSARLTSHLVTLQDTHHTVCAALKRKSA